MTEQNGGERLKELYRIAKTNGLAKTNAEFAKFIGMGTANSITDAIHGRSNASNYILRAEDALERAGVHVKDADSVESRLNDLERRVRALERMQEIKDETL